MNDTIALSRPHLAICAIARNEEEDMPGFLENVSHIADEIIVVDDGSKDETVRIVEAFGPHCHVVHRAMHPEDGFAGQRNAAIKAATADWLLHMDIDERVTPELGREILRLTTNTELNAFRYRRLTSFLQRPFRAGGWQRWNKPQLARRGAHKFINPIHEECEIEGGDARTGQLKGEMLHFVDRDYLERARKNLAYSQRMADDILASGRRVGLRGVLLLPLWRALKAYGPNGAWRYGLRGLIFSLYVFCGTFNWFATAWDRQNRRPRAELEDEIRQQWLEDAK